MKKNSFHLLYMALFLAICLIPSVGMLVLGPSEAGANEILASRPALTDKEGQLNLSVLDDTEDYIADRFAFRQELVTAWASLNAKLLGTSVQEQVVLGEDGWLFYASTEQDYMGVTAEEARLRYAARNLALMQEYAESIGARFVFTIAPNKNSLYGEHMPDRYPAGSGGNAELLTEYLEREGVPYADLFTPFRAEDEVLYFRTDSHWTSKGAALAADTVLGQSRYYPAAFTQGEAHLGDLYEMLYPAGRDTEWDTVPAEGFTFQYDSEPNGGNAIRFETSCSTGEGSLVCWRDSFGISLHPYLAQSFGKAWFSRSTAYDLTEAAKRGADTVIVEIVERNLTWLSENAPVLPAPVRSISSAVRGDDVLQGTVGKTADALTQVLIPVDGAAADEASRLYVKADGVVYEGCTVFADGERRCSAYLPNFAEGTQLFLIGEKDGVLTEYVIKLNT